MCTLTFRTHLSDETFDPAPLFTGPQRAGLTRGETALLRLLKQKAGK